MTALPFGQKKLIIGMVHLLALPGSPDYKNNFDEVRRRALQDAEALAAGGIDGMLIQNRWDRATAKYDASAETIAAMTLVTQDLVRAVNVPVGVHVLRNDTVGALGIAKVCGAAFVRTTCVVGATYLAHGIVEAEPEKYIRYRARMGASDVKMLSDIYSMHYKPVVPTPVEEIARQASSAGLADAVVVALTDSNEMANTVRTLKKANKNLPVILGGYTNKDNIRTLLHEAGADGAIVGRDFERNAGQQQGEVLAERVKEYMKIVNG